MQGSSGDSMVDYIIRAALAEETNDGWIWICGPSTEHLDSRTVVSVKQFGARHVIYAEVRKIDENFRQRYNASPRINIDCKRDTLVMAEWYRRALAIRGTTERDNQTGTVPLIVSRAKISWWGSLRAACHHPNPVVRLGTRLGVLGAWLGLLSVWLGLMGVCAMSSIALLIGFGTLGLLGIAGVWSILGAPRPQLG